MTELTKYEVTATHTDGSSVLIGYTARLSRPGLLALMRHRGPAVVAHLRIGDKDQISFTTKPRPAAKVNAWTVGFTGRTKREAKQIGELPDLTTLALGQCEFVS